MAHRTSLSLPDDLSQDLRYLSQRMGISRSALVARLLAEPAADLRSLVEQVPENPDPDTLLRLRGQSEALIDERLSALSTHWS